MDYNTKRAKLILPEYGRCIQNMVNHAMTIEDRNERQRCAFTIISLMANMHEFSGDEDDFYQKLWNHIAMISNYQLDIDYPVEIQHIDQQADQRERIPYPQKNISRRHYGHIIEQLTNHLSNMEDGPERDRLTTLVANQMKRSLAKWNSNALDDEKIMGDLAELTNNIISLQPTDINLISDKQLLSEQNSISGKSGSKKKKKK